MKGIPLTRGKVALVDDEDFEVLNTHKWYAHKDHCTFYACRQAEDGSKKKMTMHRQLLSLKLGRPLLKGEKTDHWNGNGLDNKRENLRLSTNAQNGRKL
jgi:hypothetical protein